MCCMHSSRQYRKSRCEPPAHDYHTSNNVMKLSGTPCGTECSKIYKYVQYFPSRCCATDQKAILAKSNRKNDQPSQLILDNRLRLSNPIFI